MDSRFVPTPTPETLPFWEGTLRDEIVLPMCRDTGRAFMPPRVRSPFTGGEVAWRPATGRGVLSSYVVMHRAAPGFEGDIPYVIAVVTLEEGVRMLSNLPGSNPDELRVGLAVRATFERRGDVKIPQFVIDEEDAR